MKTNLYLQQPHPPPHTRRQSQYPCAEKVYHATLLVRKEEISRTQFKATGSFANDTYPYYVQDYLTT